jgi:hypothetical protein
MSGQNPDVQMEVARLKRGRDPRYREQAERFQVLAKMETELRVQARLLELADEYQRLAGAKIIKQQG